MQVCDTQLISILSRGMHMHTSPPPLPLHPSNWTLFYPWRSLSPLPPLSHPPAKPQSVLRATIAHSAFSRCTGRQAATTMATVEPPSRPHPPVLLLLALLILTASPTFPLAAAQDNADAEAETDVEVLLQFKDGLVDPTGTLAGWRQGKTPCSGRTNVSAWSGVICTNEGRVFGLQLEGMSLSGKLDLAVLAKLPTLRVLSFSSNNFEGSMPGLNMVANLRAAFFSANKLSGEIPGDTFVGMGNIKRIHLDNNHFTGPIPKSLGELPKLAELRLDGNQFQGEIPDLKQDTLQLINVSNNALEGHIPDKFAKMGAGLFAGTHTQ